MTDSKQKTADSGVYDWNREGEVLPEARVQLVDETLAALPEVTAEARRRHLERMAGFGVVAAATRGNPVSPDEEDRIQVPGYALVSGVEGVEVALQRGAASMQIDLWLGSGIRGRRAVQAASARVGEAADLGLAVPAASVGGVAEVLESFGLRRLTMVDDGRLQPTEVRRHVGFVQARIGPEVALGWRGRNDGALGVACALAAAEVGARRLHGALLGVGPRGHAVPLDQLLVNLHLSGLAQPEALTTLVESCEAIAELRGMAIPPNYPLAGEDAFRTATGVHAAAIVKALARGEWALADRVYSGVPAGDFGKTQVIELGPMSGMSNVRYWLERAGIAADDPRAARLLARAKASDRTLTSAEIAEVLGSPL